MPFLPAPARSSTSLILAPERLEPRTLLAGQPELFRDLSGVTQDSLPTDTVVLNDVAYFFATDDTDTHLDYYETDADRDLWRSDGTEAGTWKVKELPDGDYPGAFQSIVVRGLARSGNLLYFVAGEYGVVAERGTVWRSDGTEAGSYPLAPLQLVTNPVDVNGTMYWVVSAGASGPWELWKSDGTPAGTVRVKTFAPWSGGSAPYSLTSFDGHLFFSAGTAETGMELWRSDGTEAGTVLVKDITPGPFGTRPQQMSVVGDRMFFSALQNLWVTDGTPEGTYEVEDLPAPYRPENIVDLNGVAYFILAVDRAANILWRSDGTAAGTHAVVDLPNAYDLVSRGRRLYFSGGWTSDGTAAGTYRLVSNAFDFTTVTGGPAPGVYFIMGGNPDSRGDLWRTDGTPGGTVRVIDSGPGSFGNVVGHFAATSDGRLFFGGDDEPVGHELFVTDGTPGGTRATRDINTRPTSTSPHGFAALDGVVYFFADSNVDKVNELWRTDGTAAGTRMVKELPSVPMEPLVEFEGQLVFGNWRTDGTPEGTFQWTDRRMTFGYRPSGGRLFFSAPRSNDTSHWSGYDDELWVADSTSSGARLVKNINPSEFGGRSEPRLLTDVNGTLYFTANDGTRGRELWRSDGTEAGTVLVKDITPGANGDGPVALINVNGVLHFVAYDGTQTSVWRSDGTAAGTVPVTPLVQAAVPSAALVNAGGALYALASWVIVRTDGTPEGTVRLVDDSQRRVSRMGLLHGSSLLFVSSGQSGNSEPWITDGTPEGTRLLKDIYPGEAGSSPSDFYDAGGVGYFSARHPQTGEELWRTDGTPEGTVLVADIDPSTASFARPNWSEPAGFFLAPDGAVYFAATRQDVGREMWRIRPSGGASVAGRHVFYNNSTFDGGSAAANSADDNAIAMDKRPLLPGVARAAFANLTSYSRGINGIMVDLIGASGAASLGADDFVFRTGTGSNPITWTGTVTPASVSVRPGAGAGGADRVTITFADGAVRNAWLEATVKSNGRTGLSSPDVFYFGNLVGDAGGIGPSSTSTSVNAIDFVRTRSGMNPSAPVTSPLDFNRDGRVSPIDLALVRANHFRSLPLIGAPIPAPPPARVAGGGAEQEEDDVLA
jgi:ELWxxDGT repeat protein